MDPEHEADDDDLARDVRVPEGEDDAALVRRRYLGKAVDRVQGQHRFRALCRLRAGPSTRRSVFARRLSSISAYRFHGLPRIDRLHRPRARGAHAFPARKPHRAQNWTRPRLAGQRPWRARHFRLAFARLRHVDGVDPFPALGNGLRPAPIARAAPSRVGRCPRPTRRIRGN